MEKGEEREQALRQWKQSSDDEGERVVIGSGETVGL